MSRSKIIIPRKVLLVEIERRCSLPECGAKTRIGLTKDEARAYTGFECERCEAWNTDLLNERDVPEWWEELAVTDLFAIRHHTENSTNEPGDVVARLSDNYRQTKAGE